MSKEYNFDMDDNNTTNAIDSTASVVSPSSSGGLMGLLADKRQLILMVVGGIVGAIVLFKIVEWLLTPAATPTPQPVTVTQMAPSVEPAGNNVLNARINTLENRLQDSTSQIGEMQKKVTQLEATLTDAQTQLVTMHQLMDATSQRLQELVKQVTVKPEKKAATPRYYIQAMVAGRAWLVSPSGAVTTVSVGDTMPELGTISAIDIQQGTVSTDQGQVIRYHPEDR